MVEAPSVSVCTWAPAQEEGAKKGRSTVRSLTEEVDDELKKDVAEVMATLLARNTRCCTNWIGRRGQQYYL